MKNLSNSRGSRITYLYLSMFPRFFPFAVRRGFVPTRDAVLLHQEVK